MKQLAAIRIDATIIEQLIASGALKVKGLTGDATVRRMWVEQTQRAGGTMYVVVEGDGLPMLCEHCEIPYVEVSLS